MTLSRARARATAAAAAADWDSLPDDVLVAIGICVVESCTLKDFVCFATASKRLKRLLLDSRATFSRVVGRRNEVLLWENQVLRSRPMREPLLPAEVIRTSRQLWFFECFYKGTAWFLLQNQANPDVGWNIISLKQMLWNLLRDFPSATVVVDCHVGAREGKDPALSSRHSWELGVMTNRYLSDTIRNRVEVRGWGISLGRVRPDPDHLLTIDCDIIWYQVYVRLPQPPCAGVHAAPFLELPPRPGYYEGFVVPVPDPAMIREIEIEHENFYNSRSL